jgi:hypothetical protein
MYPFHRGILVTGSMGTGTVLEFRTRSHTVTRYCGVTGFGGVATKLLIFIFT